MLGNLRHTHSVGALLLGVAAVLGGEKAVLGPGVGTGVAALGVAYDA
jgi:tRNA1(Val) A37 N6-methylase TrmN6